MARDFDEFLKAMSADFAKKVSTTSPADTVTPIMEVSLKLQFQET